MITSNGVKKILSIIIVLVILLVVAIGIYFYMQKTNKNFNPVTSPSTALANPAEKMPETNPFKAKVNPMDGYTNPFAK